MASKNTKVSPLVKKHNLNLLLYLSGCSLMSRRRESLLLAPLWCPEMICDLYFFVSFRPEIPNYLRNQLQSILIRGNRIRINENQSKINDKSFAITQYQLKPIKNNWNYWQSIRNNQNQLKSIRNNQNRWEINHNQLKQIKIKWNQFQSINNQLKSRRTNWKPIEINWNSIEDWSKLCN